MTRTLGSKMRIWLALLWLALLTVAGVWLGNALQLSGDLRKFMPEARTPAQKLLLDELGEGPGSRLLLMSLSGAEPATLARQSQALRAQLAAQREVFELVANGADAGLDAVPERLLPYRYLLSDSFDAKPLDAATVADALQARLQDLGSPAADMVEPLLPRDPTMEVLHLAESLQPAGAPQPRDGVWFDRAGKEALLVAQTHAAGFDPTGQQRAVDAIHRTFAKVAAGSASRLTLTGPGAFSVEIGGRTQTEAQWIGTLDTVGLIVLLLVAYRSWKIPVLGVLPLASAGLAGLGAVALLFDGVHGITVAFGFTLIGVVQDYPIHLFSHQCPGLDPRENARHLWPTLATGVVSTCIAYVTFLFSGVDGLRQLAVFTIAGLLVAALTTRLLLPALIDPSPRDHADSPALARLWRGIARLPRPRWSLLPLALAAVAIIAFAPGLFWQNDLSRLTPVPAADLARDAHLRQELGAPDVRYVLALPASSVDAALLASERLRPRLDVLVAQGELAGYDMAARYLPSVATQRRRQAALPDPTQAQALIAAAVAATPFRRDAFASFLADLQRARSAPPLTTRDLRGTPLATSVGGLLLERPDHATALVSLTGLRDPARLASAVQGSGAQLLDLKDASESLVAAYRGRVLGALSVAALLLVLTVAIALRTPRRIARVLLPMALTTLLILAILRGCGVELNLFHLIALILAAGLGLDYALFFDHAGDDRADQLRTLHALIVCSLMTLLVFALLAASSIPVLRAIGSTVALGVLFNFVLALLVSRETASEAAQESRYAHSH
ncbi:MMPL family transporter [Xanthomonas albilineans]|uniref:MMPL family transporter n=1 Tax=Xanthomonas albilineans TaxID=29447 RepID=UPI0005F3127D|nr:MMPL family transporter [Xanthomonas albilineans]